MNALSASHSPAADSTSVWSTVCRSKVERLMTLSTSAVVVCCCNDSRSSFRRRVLDRDDRLTRKALNQLYLLFGEGANLLPVNADDADQFAFSENRHGDEGANPREVSKSPDIWIAFQVWRDRPQILGVHCLLGLDD